MMNKNVKTRFSNRVENYVKYRPSYPKGAIQYLIDLGITNKSDVADIGSGTGILSHLLIENVNKLYAIEPNNEMRLAAESSLKNHDNFISIIASAEKTSLATNSIDFITVAQAFHWFDKKATLKEFKRILKEPGKLILIWNNRTNNTPFLKGYEELLLKYGTDYKKVNHKNLSNQEIESCFIKDYNKTVFDNFQELDFEAFIGRVFSSSYTPVPGESGYKELNIGLEDLFKLYSENGYIRFKYKTEIYSGNI